MENKGNIYCNACGKMIKTENGWWNIDTGSAMDEGYPMLLCLDDLKEYYFEDDETIIEIVNA